MNLAATILRTPARRLCAAGLAAALSLGGCAAPGQPPTDAAKSAALREFAAVYDVGADWPRLAPKIARDSLPRLEAAVHADIDADPLPAADREAAHRRVPALLPQGRAELADALRAFDAAALSSYAAQAIYGKYFDTGELRAMAAFYGSSTGRKLSALTPELVAESRRPGAKDVMARHFDEAELREIAAFWASPAGTRMAASAESIREDLHARFVEDSEPALQAVARRLATQAEADDGPAAAPAR
ncbi:MAG: DUF2059 domain-containing protein [Burkholderiaceae bacterium]